MNAVLISCIRIMREAGGSVIPDPRLIFCGARDFLALRHSEDEADWRMESEAAVPALQKVGWTRR